jgi:hypothetical protein
VIIGFVLTANEKKALWSQTSLILQGIYYLTLGFVSISKVVNTMGEIVLCPHKSFWKLLIMVMVMILITVFVI